MHIASVIVDGFKLLQQFKLPLNKFNCLIGQNGSGKSTVVQLIDFVGHLIRGRAATWFYDRKILMQSILPFGIDKETITVKATFSNLDNEWQSTCDVRYAECVSELFSKKDGSDEIIQFLNSILTIAKLPKFLCELPGDRFLAIADKMSKSFPQVKGIEANIALSGDCEIVIVEKSGARIRQPHISNGMMNALNIFAALESDASFLLFDDIENGLHPDAMEFILDELLNAKQQVLITTHSPMILNYLDDDVAKESVIYLYKNEQCRTVSTPFFKIPGMADKLLVMGPGESYIDTDLSQLNKALAGGTPTP